MPTLFMARARSIPPPPADQTVILLAKGLEAYGGPEHVPKELFSYLLVVGCAVDDLDEARSAVTAHWRDCFGEEVALEVLASTLGEMQRGVRKGFHGIEPGGIFLNGRAVAFKSTSQAAFQSAADLIRDTTLRKPWKLWQ